MGLIRDRLHGESQSHPETTITLLTCGDHCDVSDHGGGGAWGAGGHVPLINAGPDEMLSPSCCQRALGGREEHLATGCKF